MGMASLRPYLLVILRLAARAAQARVGVRGWGRVRWQEPFDAITTALQEGKGLAECLKAAEEAEAGQSVADAAAKAERAEALAKETPQQRAAREREEMAARGRF